MNIYRRILGFTMIVLGVFGLVSQRMAATSPAREIAAVSATPVVFAGETDMPKLENANVQSREITGSLSSEIRNWAAASAKPQWLAYSVPVVAGNRFICCGNYSNDSDAHQNCGPCRLEEKHSGVNIRTDDYIDKKVKLEAPREISIFLRAESGNINAIRVVSQECTVDAGGLGVTWLNHAKPAESVAFLKTFVQSEAFENNYKDAVSRRAMMAIALHADPSAQQALESFVAPGQKEELRKDTLFWLGEARGADGFRVLEKLARIDPSAEVRKQVTFALSISPEPQAISEMIRMAHEDKESEVRGQALFWIAQKAGKVAASTITSAIENDPDTEVKKKAVFALSQMPNEEGVPKLIHVAQNNRNPEVRKQAMFWLGQSNDARALDFFETLLSK